MQSINELENTLKQASGWHKSRTQCLVHIRPDSVAVRSVNLKEDVCDIAGEARTDSHYRRL